MQLEEEVAVLHIAQDGFDIHASADSAEHLVRLWLCPRLEQRVKLLVAGCSALCLVILSFQGRRSQLSRIQAEEDASAGIVVACRARRPLSAALESSGQRGSARPSPLDLLAQEGGEKSP